jgi:hypothetical protein
VVKFPTKFVAKIPDILVVKGVDKIAAMLAKIFWLKLCKITKFSSGYISSIHW